MLSDPQIVCRVMVSGFRPFLLPASVIPDLCRSWTLSPDTWLPIVSLRYLPQPTESSTLFPQFHLSDVFAINRSCFRNLNPPVFIYDSATPTIYQEILEHFMLPSADKLYGDADFIFQQDLAPACSYLMQ